MDIAIIVAIAAAGISALGVGTALIVLVVRGGFLLGRLVTQVEELAAAVGQLRAEMQQSNQELRAEAQQNNQGLRAEMQQSNQELRAEMQQSNQELRAEAQQNNQTLTVAINELRAEVQQSNQTLAALANHTHDTDGRTVFQVPPGASR